ncbi:RNA polymerase 2 subunit A C-terminal domain containing protein phosphatase [Coccidioides immitis RMSCC 3703]|uniref:RNA polymerase II subunit A C-terminal domain phosphatase n=1 Tax=Coccidioides immitis RMSCC 3703 TaxID=454286 RepID=A0A0J8R3U0_COCIT|nr:RNA polymerase 2 subunit A C-terminal domain containing protein phosphatase [Coccidioides immitis RMSCC 3703]
MLLKLSSSLYYPITVTELLRQRGDNVNQGDALFAYYYHTTVTEGDGLGNKRDVVRKFPTKFESSVDGTLLEWKITEGQVIERPIDIAEIDEPLFSMMYSLGGMFNYNTEVLDSSRAPIRMVHDNASLTVSKDEATRVEEDAKRRLLSSRKLSLVVDLDQTIIHATVDPTVAEWQEDKTNPNHEAVKDVRAFQLVDDGPGMRGCWYYIKLRPGLEDFLRSISSLYELHIYTMGTRAYAQNIANIVDPDRKIFGDRILSRDESGSLTAKNLQRLFPVDTKMVVIIDDRGDVWNWSDNLIRVHPYDFFVGIGDINSSFLPKKQEFKPMSKARAKAKKQLDVRSEVEPKPEMNGSSAIDVDEKPKEENGDSSSDDSQDSMRHRHHLLEDNDAELYQLEERLKLIHRRFFEEYDRKRSSALGGRVSALRGERVHPKDKDVDLRIVPDIKIIMPQIKRRILEAVVVVFSGVIPLDKDTQNAEISLWAKSFGAIITQKIDSRTTHLVAGRNRTAKVREATRYPKIKIVTVQWLLDSLTQWKRLDEEPYLVPVHPDDRGEPISLLGNSPNDAKELDDAGYLSSSEEDTTSADDDESDFSKGRSQNDELENADEEILLSTGLDSHSLIGYDAEEQAEVHDELKEFLGSDNEESESDSDASMLQGTSMSRADRKRKRDLESDESGGEYRGATERAPGEPAGLRLSQKIKRSHERTTGLKEVSNASSIEHPGPPPVDTSSELLSDKAQEQAIAGDTSSGANADVRKDSAMVDLAAGDEEDDEDELEREMLAAFENDNWDESKVEEDAGDNG